MTSKRPRRLVENEEYGAFARRVLRACARRMGDGDVGALALMLGLAVCGREDLSWDQLVARSGPA